MKGDSMVLPTVPDRPLESALARVTRLPSDAVLTLAAIACAAIAYALLHQRHYLAYVDDAWCVSQAHFFFETGRAEDSLFRAIDAPDRVLVFGKSYFYLYGAILSRVGWTKSNAHLLSALLVWLSAGTWFLICRRLKCSSNVQKLAPLSMLLFPAYFSAGNLARYDALVFLLSSLTFLCFLHRQYLLSGLLLMVAIECHPMGVTGAFYVLAYVVHERHRLARNRKTVVAAVLSVTAGAAAGLAYIRWLHPDVSIARVQTVLALNSTMGGFKYGLFVKYFTQTYWYRHVWELPLIAGTAVLFIRRRLSRSHAFVPVLLATLIVEAIVIRRPNANYMIFFYPALSLMIFVTLDEAALLPKVLPLIATALLAVYGLTYAAHSDFDFNRVTAETRASLADETIPVVGMPDNWFAVPERQFYPIYPSAPDIPQLDLKEFYLIRNDYVSSQSNNYDELMARLDRTHACNLVRSFRAYRTHDVAVYRCMRAPG